MSDPTLGMQLSLTFPEPNGLAVLRPAVPSGGRLATQMERDLDALGAEFSTVVLDLRGVDALGAECAAVVVRARAAAARRGHRLVTVGTTDAVQRELVVCGGLAQGAR